ncbi:MAG: SpoIIE family protein phosphatase, partial [Vicingaceae bacterium]
NNIGYTYFKKKNIQKALEHYNESITIRKKLNDKRGIATCYNNIASAHEHQLDNDKAMEFYLKSNQLYSELGSKLGVSTSSVNIGRVLLASNKLQEAKKHVLLGLELARKAGSTRNIQGASELLSRIYQQEGKGMKALEMYKLYVLMRDSIDNIQSQKALIQQNAKYQYQREKAKDDAEHEKVMAVKQAEKEKQTIVSYAIGFGLLLALIFAVFVFNRLKVTRKQKTVIETQNNEIVDSITYAKRIQEAILSSTVIFENLFPESFIYYQPKDIIAGDFYWIETASVNEENTNEDLIFFAAADCTGHGVPGAMVSVVCSNALNSAIREFKLTDPGLILSKASNIVVNQFNKSTTASISNIRDGMDIALCVLNKKTNVLHFAGANNPLWLLRKGSDVIEEIKATRQAVGKIENPKPFKTNTIKMQSGDQIYLFSDGFADQFGGEKGKKMMKRRFKELLITNSGESMKSQETKLSNYFTSWKSELDQIDDVCVMGIKI